MDLFYHLSLEGHSKLTKTNKSKKCNNWNPNFFPLQLTLDEILGGSLLTTKHSGGRYQYVPAPCDVNSMLSSSVSIILLKPKSVIFTSPQRDPLPTRRIFPDEENVFSDKNYRGNTCKDTLNARKYNCTALHGAITFGVIMLDISTQLVSGNL